MKPVEISILVLNFFLLHGQLVDSDDTFEPESHKNWGLLPPKNKCGLSAQQRIIGGHEVVMGAYPWIARVAFLRPGSPRYQNGQLNVNERSIAYGCGGSLISKYYVITAAHCTDDPPSITYVRLGEHNTRTNPDCEKQGGSAVCAPPVQDIPVAKVIRHELYSGDRHMTNDIALLKLQSPPVLNQYVQPVCLPFGVGMTKDFEGEDATVAGWGKTENHRIASVLLAVTQKVTSTQLCKEEYARNEVNIDDTQGQMCVGGKVGKDSCNGDSGGPLIWTGSFDPTISARAYLLGLVSLGPESCGVYEIPGVYSRISYFLRWVLDHMEE